MDLNQTRESQGTFGAALTPTQRCRLRTHVSIEGSVLPVFVLLWVGINQDSRGSLGSSVSNLGDIYHQR